MTSANSDFINTATVVRIITPSLVSVILDDNGRQLQAVFSPEFRKSLIGDKSLEVEAGTMVKVELSPYSDSRCRIIEILGS